MRNLITASLLVVTACWGSAQAAENGSLEEQLTQSAGRPAADKERDAGRRPAQVVEFLGIERGMTVIDLMAAAGYYTEVLSTAVGPEGKVYMQNVPAALTGQRGTSTEQAIVERLDGNRLANVERLNSNFDDLGLEENSVDAAIIALEIHELSNSDDPAQMTEFFASMNHVLKSGGVLGVIEHAGDPANDNKALHRGLETDVVAAAEEAGFQLEASSDILRNSEDDKTKMVFDPSVRGKTDRFVLKLIKP